MNIIIIFLFKRIFYYNKKKLNHVRKHFSFSHKILCIAVVFYLFIKTHGFFSFSFSFCFFYDFFLNYFYRFYFLMLRWFIFFFLFIFSFYEVSVVCWGNLDCLSLWIWWFFFFNWTWFFYSLFLFYIVKKIILEKTMLLNFIK